MLQHLRDSWNQLKDGEPGERFQEHYEQRKQNRGSVAGRVAWLALGIAILAAGLFMMVAPGPGILGIFVGGGLIAREALFMARFLDWAEVKLRALAGVGIRFWRRSPTIVRVAVVLLIVVVAAGAGYGAYRLMFA